MKIVQQTLLKLLYVNPFYGNLLIQAKKQPTSYPAPMGVCIENGRVVLLYNEIILQEMLNEEGWEPLVGVGEHECLHLIFKHCLRQNDRKAMVVIGGKVLSLWNVSADIAVNQLITKKLPRSVLRHELFGLKAGLTAEQYYDILYQQAKANGSMAGDGSQGGDQDKDGSGDQSSQNEGQESGQGKQGKWSSSPSLQGKGLADDHSEWKDIAANEKHTSMDNAVVKAAVESALKQAKTMGNCPGSVAEAIKQLLLPPTIPWRRVLRQLVGFTIKVNTESTWKRVSRRLGEDQKGKKPIKSSEIYIVIDTSGSIGQVDFQNFMSEIYAIKNAYPIEINMIECDAAIQKEYKLKKNIDVNFLGRGGTSFEPPFTHLAKKKIRPTMLIYFTDLCGTFPQQKPKYPVLWVKAPGYAKSDVPFGKLLCIERDKN